MSEVLACPACGAENRSGARFCDECGGRLAAPVAIAEERKTVTTLFCDLVAFTAMSEAADPEDVDALLGDYFARATKVIESHGGTVEKFIGDAVVGVFGVPAVHEDDPERAVRAGLRILESLEGMTRPDGSALQARCGVNTGEALVRLDVDPSSGRGFLTGDAVNTAARLEAAAPPHGVAVGALTHELTSRVIEYEGLPPVVAKGKAEPVAAWLAREARARTGLRTAGAVTTPFLGRDADLAALELALGEAVAARQTRFCFMVGEPGIGKSRLVLEFARLLDAKPEIVTWRQGRCLPYGEAVALSALSEVVRAHAGIADTDDGVTVQRKLETVLPEGEDAPWLRQRLGPLLGLPAPEASAEEGFAAWTRFVTHIAARGPTVLVFEDLHWADESLMAFLVHLAAQKLAVPLLILATGRPEVLQGHHEMFVETCGTLLQLSPLGRKASERLVSSLLGWQLDDALVTPVAEQIGGNPLYAEEYARLLLERNLVEKTAAAPRRMEEDELPAPDSVQAVLAARLDTLPADHKALLCDAAVFGERFSVRGVAALGRHSWQEAAELLAALSARQLVRSTVDSAPENGPEYLFWHALVRDVAYRQMPRGSRAAKHVAAAEWIEATSANPNGVSEVLAQHYLMALQLASAPGAPAAGPLTAAAVHWLSEAGRRTLPLDVNAADGYFAQALELASDDSPERPLLLKGSGEVLQTRARFREAAEHYELAIPQLLALGDRTSAALAMQRLSAVLSELGRKGSGELLERGVQLLEGEGPSPELVEALSVQATYLGGATGDQDGALLLAQRALDLAAELGLPTPPLALSTRGTVRCLTGDESGLEDCRRALEEAASQGLSSWQAVLQFNYGALLDCVEGLAGSLARTQRGIELAERRGLGEFVLFNRLGCAEVLFLTGRWDEALGMTAELTVELEEAGSVMGLVFLRRHQCVALSRRGLGDQVVDNARWLVNMATAGEPVLALAGLQGACVTLSHLGHAEEAVDLLGELLAIDYSGFDSNKGIFMPEAARISLSLGQRDVPLQLLEVAPGVQSDIADGLASVRAQLAEFDGRLEEAGICFADAAARWHEFGVPYEEGQALLGQGRCLVAVGRAPEAAPPLAAAREIFARLGALPALEETDAVLAAAGL